MTVHSTTTPWGFIFTVCHCDRSNTVLMFLKFPGLLVRENIFHLYRSHMYFFFEIIYIFCLFSTGALVAFLLTFMSYFYIWSNLLIFSSLTSLQSRCLGAIVWYWARSHISRVPNSAAPAQPMLAVLWQVVFMFNLKSSPSSGELMFVERYQEVIQELARVEHKIENQNSDGGSSTIRRTGSGRSTLQAIGSAAAAGATRAVRALEEGGTRGKATKSQAPHKGEQKSRAGHLPWSIAVLTHTESVSSCAQIP